MTLSLTGANNLHNTTVLSGTKAANLGTVETGSIVNVIVSYLT